jgi:hypothetical protein
MRTNNQTKMYQDYKWGIKYKLFVVVLEKKDFIPELFRGEAVSLLSLPHSSAQLSSSTSVRIVDLKLSYHAPCLMNIQTRELMYPLHMKRNWIVT